MIDACTLPLPFRDIANLPDGLLQTKQQGSSVSETSKEQYSLLVSAWRKAFPHSGTMAADLLLSAPGKLQ